MSDETRKGPFRDEGNLYDANQLLKQIEGEGRVAIQLPDNLKAGDRIDNLAKAIETNLNPQDNILLYSTQLGILSCSNYDGRETLLESLTIRTRRKRPINKTPGPVIMQWAGRHTHLYLTIEYTKGVCKVKKIVLND